ncbi:MAG: hypothetical protein RIG63_27915 [Coleofasciculus chthonoplastes F3-SA18-01]|jgi:hypothetical protein|uniref:hypothetical protein n=1 Tax=Coleofasciculus chthonoplastes TaxID=64178 RepID=UPI003303F26B
MRYKNLTAIGILAAIFGLANPVSAQSPVTTKADDVTLSGESLKGIEQRNLGDDFDQFFLDDPALAWRGTGGSQINFNNQAGADFQLIDDVEISVNEPLSPPISPINFRRHENLSSGLDRVEVQVKLD